ncbi:MAG: radical SAM/SPASM domain-containing protein, partial [Candidatus Ratteibacteria bacterium]
MFEMNLKVQVNANIHFLYKSPAEPVSEEFLEYRKKWHQNPETFTVSNFPLHLDIESTSLCNLHCPFCSFKTIHRTWKRGHMQWNLYKKIIDEGAENHLYSIKLSLRGEPLLHPDIFKMIEYAREKGILDIYFNTNAVLMDTEIAERIVGSGINRISISFEGFEKTLYEKNRVGACFEKVIKNIEELINKKSQKNSKTPRIRIQTVLIPEMETILEDYKKFWMGKGVDEIAYLDFEKDPEKDEDLSYPWICPQLWQRMTIWYDGTLIPCVHDTYGIMKLGNVSEISISDVWNSVIENAYRQIHRAGFGETLYACRICPLRAGQVRKIKMEGNND